MSDIFKDYIHKIKGTKAEKEKKTIIKNVTNNIKTDQKLKKFTNMTKKIDNPIQKQLSGSEWRKKIAKLISDKAGKAGKIAKKVPGLGAIAGIVSAIATGDASAAIPADLGDKLGPKKGSADYDIESPDKFEMIKGILKKRKRK